MKTEPISACTITIGKDCFRCGASNFTQQHIFQCRVANEKCGKCRTVGHFAQCCGKFRSETQEAAQNKSNQNAARRINYIDDDDSSNGSYDEPTGSIVLTIGGIG